MLGTFMGEDRMRLQDKMNENFVFPSVGSIFAAQKEGKTFPWRVGKMRFAFSEKKGGEG